ncbi:HlyD family type I secretion periplasmic adaptor subunit [Halomonas beimenensis]|uniref:Membrane fusion protein (MFP) family protein n=1 Tax=Halomonas beimenensis TaxID=475662 RepID=A0A291PAH1_9GAMM|nr:HlyD family type I secretion periplasmic adaptor subunit [Halomonas beimenensis]ATJ83867.1 type I secretion system, membrane fusion protein LapC [Halomonas beimenensis]
MTESRPSSLEQRSFEAIGQFSLRGGKPMRPLIDRLFARGVSSLHLHRDWASDADWARLQQEPLRARGLLYVVFLSLILLAGWAFLAQLDEVARGAGRVIPSSQLQKVQSYDGGVVQEILAREGERVEEGQLLMRLDPTRFVANFRENRAQAQALQARIAGLRALVNGEPFRPGAALVEEAPELVAQERELHASRRAELEEARDIARERLEQRREELNEAQSRVDTASRELRMVNRELELTRPLLEAGAVSEVEVLRLEREVSRASGERNQARSQVARLEAAVEEAEARLREVVLEKRGEWRDRLASAVGELSALDESSAGLQDRVRLAEIRSPVDGVVQRMHINTLGGVAQPGQDVVEIVPEDELLLVEARIAPRDIAFLRPGQPATIKLTAYDYAIYGGLEAELEHISADTIADDDDNTFYLVRVRATEESLAGFRRRELTIIPGMTAQVDVITGKRSVLEYLLKPILRGAGNALSER